MHYFGKALAKLTSSRGPGDRACILFGGTNAKQVVAPGAVGRHST